MRGYVGAVQNTRLRFFRIQVRAARLDVVQTSPGADIEGRVRHPHQRHFVEEVLLRAGGNIIVG